MSDDTRRILDLLAQGKITVDEADRLIAAVGEQAAAPKAEDCEPGKLRYLRIAVHKPANERRGDKDVNIRVPIAMVRGGMRLGAMIPGLAGDQLRRSCARNCARRASTWTSRSSTRRRSKAR